MQITGKIWVEKAARKCELPTLVAKKNVKLVICRIRDYQICGAVAIEITNAEYPGKIGKCITRGEGGDYRLLKRAVAIPQQRCNNSGRARASAHDQVQIAIG